jgi:hypothetical protein
MWSIATSTLVPWITKKPERSGPIFLPIPPDSQQHADGKVGALVPDKYEILQNGLYEILILV